ncbi:hypothetical protein Ocin01_15041 [Orchesella cincta]|uniref:Uncharacterized protein n=1 Tax=Orchesella cincta TaxID=48709 RepID=A0A1D2MF98_ORCCI|nr:hypothetical protein Ocin01_15041 [Orchesella cincta]
MGKLIAILALIAVLTVQKGQADKPWPDWSCYPEFEALAKTHSDKVQTGMEFAKATMEDCKKDDVRGNDCEKECILKKLLTRAVELKTGSSDWTSSGILAHVGQHKDDLFARLTGVFSSAPEIAKKVKDNCYEMSKGITTKSCEEKEAFFQCLDNAWKC